MMLAVKVRSLFVQAADYLCRTGLLCKAAVPLSKADFFSSLQSPLLLRKSVPQSSR